MVRERFGSLEAEKGKFGKVKKRKGFYPMGYLKIIIKTMICTSKM